MSGLAIRTRCVAALLVLVLAATVESRSYRGARPLRDGAMARTTWWWWETTTEELLYETTTEELVYETTTAPPETEVPTTTTPLPSTTLLPTLAPTLAPTEKPEALPCGDAEVREVLRVHRSRRSVDFPPTTLFTVEYVDGALEIHLEQAPGAAWTLFWVEQGGAPAPCYKHEGVGTSRVTIEDVLPASDYLICLLQGPDFVASPFNCRAHSTVPHTTGYWK